MASGREDEVLVVKNYVCISNVQVTCSFTPIADIRYSGVSADSLHGAMEKFAIIGTCFSRLNNFCFHHADKPFSEFRGGLVMKAFINGIKEVLFSYWSAVFMTEGLNLI